MSLATSYDEVPYPRLAFPLTHPSHLATIGRLLGFASADVENCRVLELGCASGANLVPIAYALPKSRFIGIDFSERQVSDGREFIAALGLSNVSLERLDILHVAESLRDSDCASRRDATAWASAGPFDFIIAHGIYSWVPDPVKDALLAACRALLGAVRHRLRQLQLLSRLQNARHAPPDVPVSWPQCDGPRDYAATTRRFLDFMQTALSGGDGAYRAVAPPARRRSGRSARRGASPRRSGARQRSAILT